MNSNNEIYQNALDRIERDKDCKPRCGCNVIGVTGPTGPTGPAGGPTGATGATGPTAWLFKSSIYIKLKSSI